MPQPDWLIDRAGLSKRFPPRVRARELWRVAEPHLAEALARRLALQGAAECPAPPAAPLTGGSRVLLVVGTLHPSGREQAAVLGKSGTAVTVPVTVASEPTP